MSRQFSISVSGHLLLIANLECFPLRPAPSAFAASEFRASRLLVSALGWAELSESATDDEPGIMAENYVSSSFVSYRWTLSKVV